MGEQDFGGGVHGKAALAFTSAKGAPSALEPSLKGLWQRPPGSKEYDTRRRSELGVYAFDIMTSPPPTDSGPAPAEAVALASEVLRRFPECFWFRSDHAPLASVSEVQLVIRRLRQHGPREAWDAAFRIEQCL